ncbi:MAG: class I tRNA ligase family protein, partial [Muribaculaceae bacterium]|nr:class I tRNA ligase family protein [Muribaculaceae bacterium]
PKINYVVVRTYNPYTGKPVTVVLADDLVKNYFKAEGKNADLAVYQLGDKIVPYQIVGCFKGTELTGMRYKQLLPWVKPIDKLDHRAPEYVKVLAENKENIFTVGNDTYVVAASKAFRVISGDFVTTEDGTGIVHIAPTFGADDAKVAKAADVPGLFMITNRGEMRPMVDLTGRYYPIDMLADHFVEKCVNIRLYSSHAGDYVKNAYDPEFNKDGKYDQAAAEKAEDLNVKLCLEMKQQGEVFKIEKHIHSYPHCWRTDKPVLYYPLDSWFIRTPEARERLIELNKNIKWKPAATGTGRFGKWLENVQDWNLSRSRFWGTPLPIWRTEDGAEEICIDSYATLYNEIEKSVDTGIMKENPLAKKGFQPGDYSKANYELIDMHRPYVDDIVLVSP